ncbi:guanine nucleotide-binding protein g(o) subunit alpha [Anaeramoeba flamelloides]|uniref:Guanine nucleotide-binding protein g(O) subunit alpha n=1 Tax=Anaeramoeba flamelloides TaxID=1746091 RepID=A0AAV7Y9U4_9EUKA|nr:guanine nucleotide-binding protein g(o) subunit alpha [Anaeramoeba flamelloides]KAJ6232901.1 guanine nucleotide-binding protein g(o) subunit alpha [Anaeramoeba flamelloides]
MGVVKSKEKQKEAKRNKLIEKKFREEKKKLDKQVKILLLGTGDSGKSTIVKQMQILYKGGFQEKEIEQYRKAIRTQIKGYIKVLIRGCNESGFALLEENQTCAEDYLRTVKKNNPEISEQNKNDIIKLWADPALKKAYEIHDQFQLPNVAKYFLDKTEEIAKQDFNPNEKDILNCRISTIGVKEIQFQVKDDNWRLVDVGGQRSERRKWMHQFEDIDILIFVIAVSEYNLSLYEEQTVNRMHESLSVFQKTTKNDFLKKKNIVLLFNKVDLFKEKIKKIPLTVCFPEYTGKQEFEACGDYIQKKFIKVAKKRKGRTIKCHYTCATDTNLMKNVIAEVMNSVTAGHIQVYF